MCFKRSKCVCVVLREDTIEDIVVLRTFYFLRFFNWPPTGVAAPKHPERAEKPIGAWEKPIGTKLVCAKARVQKPMCEALCKARVQSLCTKLVCKVRVQSSCAKARVQKHVCAEARV